MTQGLQENQGDELGQIGLVFNNFEGLCSKYDGPLIYQGQTILIISIKLSSYYSFLSLTQV